MAAFGERLRLLREERDITQKKLSAIIGISPRMVSFYESGAHFPRDERIIAVLAQYFGVTTDYLLGVNSLRTEEPLLALIQGFAALPETARESFMEYLEYLLHKYQDSTPEPPARPKQV